MIQLRELVPLEVLYSQSHGSGCVGKLWDNHHSSFAAFISRYSPCGVLEIGGAHGILSRKYHNLKDTKWTIIEPNPTPSEDVRATFIKGFFDENFQFEQPYDAVVHSHVFEHIYDPNLFMQHLANFLSEGKMMFFSVPNMQVMLERKYTNCINFEHTIFLTEPYIEYLLAKYGFRIDKKEYFLDDHSIFYATYRDSKIKPITLSGNLYDKNKKLYMDYISYHERLVAELNHKINRAGGSVYLFGAHIFAQYLVAFGLNTEKIVCILDNDPNKQGKRLYGTDKMVASPKILKDARNPSVILRAGVYNDEIKKDILQNINGNVEFWE